MIPANYLIVEAFKCKWKNFLEKIALEDKNSFQYLMEYAKRHTLVGPELNPFQPIILSILLEQEKEIYRLEKQLTPESKKKCPRCNSEKNTEDFIGALCPDCREYLMFPSKNKTN